MMVMMIMVMMVMMIMVMMVMIMYDKAAHRVYSIYEEPGDAYPPTLKIKISGM